MRLLVLIMLAATCVAAFSACSTPGGSLRERVALSDCPEMEGYPDCQGGHRVSQPPAVVLTGR